VFGETFKHQLQNDNELWAEFNKINISEYVQKTAPVYYVRSCTLNQMDCRKFWKHRTTFLGQCLELHANDVLASWETAAEVIKLV